MVCHAVISCFSRVPRFPTLWTIAFQDPLSTGFSQQECLSWLLCPPPGDLPDSGTESMSLKSLALTDRFLPLAPPGKPHYIT